MRCCPESPISSHENNVHSLATRDGIIPLNFPVYALSTHNQREWSQRENELLAVELADGGVLMPPENYHAMTWDEQPESIKEDNFLSLLVQEGLYSSEVLRTLQASWTKLPFRPILSEYLHSCIIYGIMCLPFIAHQ